MKKYLAFILVLAMAIAMVGCAGDNTPTNPTEGSTEPSTQGTEPVTTTTPVTEPGVTEPAVTVMTKAEFDAAAMDSQVVIETYVQTIESWYNGACHIYAQSEDGGYYIYSLACTEDEAAQLVPGTKIRVTGYKGEWSGEIEIMDPTIEILEGSYIVTEALDVTALLGTDELAAHMNELVAFKGMTVAASTDANGNEAPYLYKWDGSGSQGDDLYFNVALGDQVYTFSVNVYMIGTGVDSDVYKAVEALQIGDVIDLEGFLYWYNGAQPHITSVKAAG